MSLDSNRAAICWISFAGIVAMSCDSGPWHRVAFERQAEPPHLSTNAYGMVSIGRVNTIESGERAALMEYFNSSNIAFFTEGTVVYDGMVLERQVEDARKLLLAKRPPATFEPAMELGQSPNQAVQRTGASGSAQLTNRTSPTAGSGR